MDLNEENILSAVNERKRKKKHLKISNKRKKLDTEHFDKCDGTLINSMIDIKVPFQNSELNTTAEFRNKNVKCDIVSKNNNGTSPESQNEDSNNLKIETVMPEVKDKIVEFKSGSSEKEMAKSALKRKRAKSTKRCSKFKKCSITATDGNNRPAMSENSFENKVPKDNGQKDPALEGLNSVLKRHDWSSIFDINIPLIGKNVMPDIDVKPFTSRYDLAVLRNEKRFRHQKEEEVEIPNTSYAELREQQKNRSEEEKEIDAARKQRHDIAVAQYVIRITIKILQQLQSNKIDEKRVGQLFTKFLRCSVRPMSLLYVPHFVHTMLFCRGHKKFSRQLRCLVNDCYYKCHCMFPVPVGYNFETVFFSEVKKFLPNFYHKFNNMLLDYGDFSDSDSTD